MASNTQRVKCSAVKPKYPLQQGLTPLTYINPIIRRGGEQGDKKVLECHTLHEIELSHLPTWAEIEYQGWIPFSTTKFQVHEPLVIWFNKLVQFSYDDNVDGSVVKAEIDRGVYVERQGSTQDNGQLVWYNKEERDVPKRQRIARGSEDPDESASEGDDVARGPDSLSMTS
ncbi:hypothetical protein LIER_24229 [Lithospermum erythrorhizon]|uniref:Uncharacterized protein n=1 Tax=Lithospermum erythrorhizon TaxID=34254 RepID=A0AAV3R0M1_LITER